MPFTVAHVAAAWPVNALTRGRVDLPALVIGCLVPDAPYLPALQPTGHALSHTPISLLTFCLPVGFGIYLLYRGIVVRPVLLLLPDGHRSRLGSLTNRREGHGGWRLAVIALSILLGASTHLAWDAFTHSEGVGVREFPVLSTIAFTIGDRSIPWFKLLQWGSGVGGLAALLAWHQVWYRRAIGRGFASEPGLPPLIRRLITSSIVLLTLAMGLLVGVSAVRRYDGPLHPFHIFAVRAATGSMTAFALLVLVYSLSMQAIFIRGRAGAGQPGEIG